MKRLLAASAMALVLATTPAPAATVIAAGDVAGSWSTDTVVGNMIRARSGVPVLLLGDAAYNRGTASEFNTYYQPAWGTFKDRTWPVPGNHEYDDPAGGARGFYGYFGSKATTARVSRLLFSGLAVYRINEAFCGAPEGCALSSADHSNLLSQLRADTARCIIAITHFPRYSTGSHGSQSVHEGLWDTLVAGGVTFVLAGHDHDYERFVPLNANGQRDDLRGLTQFVAGTGGQPANPKVRSDSRSAVFVRANGILEITIDPVRPILSWRFVAVGGAVRDSGSRACVA